MTVSENEEAIYKQLNKNRLKLYATLSKKINIDTDNYFYVNDGTSLYYPDLENLDEFIFWDPNPQQPCICPQFTNEGNGVVSFLGAVFKEGWINTEQWEMVADIKFGELYKTGLILLTDADNPFPKNSYQSEFKGRWGISAWERFIGTPYTLDGNPHYEITYEGDSEKFTSYSSSWANNVWHSLHMKKVSSTRLIVWLDDNENDKIIYDWEELSDVERVTFGATMNHNTGDYTLSRYDSNHQLVPYCGYPNSRLYVKDLYVFYPSLPTNRLTALCEDTKKIKCSTNNSVTVPPQPTIVNGNTLAINEFNIHNKIQYCNNVLRYTLRKCDIEFNDSYDNSGNYTGINSMQELIKLINQIKSPASITINDMYSAYVNPIQLLGDKSLVQTNETYNLIAEVVDKGAGISIDFMKDNEILATKTTNENGIATYEVTGDGSGLDKYYAKSGALKSNELTVIDGVLLDKGTSISYNDLFNDMGSFTRMGDGTSVYYQNTGSSTYQVYLNRMDFNEKEYAIDIELVENNYATLQVGRYKTNSSNQYNSKTITGNGKIHIELLNDGIYWYQNKELIQSNTTITNGEKFTFFILTPKNTTSDFKYKNLVVYPLESKESTPGEPVVTSLTLSNTKDILSAYDSESTTLTATVKNQNGSVMSGQTVTFKKDNITLDTLTTDANGEATYEYTSNGDGDVTITVECESLTEDIIIEDCIFYLPTENSYQKSSGTLYQKLYDNITSSIPANFEWSIDMKASVVTSSSEQRVFLAPTFSSYGQPSNGLWVQFGDSVVTGGIRTNSVTTALITLPSVVDTYYNFKLIRSNDNITGVVDGTNIGTLTATWLDSQTNWLLSIILWKTGVLTIKNIKIKPL